VFESSVTCLHGIIVVVNLAHDLVNNSIRTRPNFLLYNEVLQSHIINMLCQRISGVAQMVCIGTVD